MSTQNVIYLLAAFSECTSPRVIGEEGGNGTEKRDSDRVVPGNFTEWRNNVSYATFPEWRAVRVWGGGGGSLQILTVRERTNESETERVKTVGKRVERCSHSLACN